LTKVKANFENQIVFAGVDIHKRSWKAAIYLGDFSPDITYKNKRQEYKIPKRLCLIFKRK